MATVDFGMVREGVREAARRAFTLVRGKHPEERFYAFAMCVDDESPSVCASANTEEGYRRCLKRYEPRRAEDEAILAKVGMSFEDHANYYRWNLPEWAYHAVESREMRALDPLLGDPNQIEEEDPEGFEEFKARLYGAMILGMRDLDGEGFFGAGEARGGVVLLGDVVNPPDKYWFALESAKLLNPAATFRGFEGQWMAWMGASEREIIRDPGAHSATYGLLKAVLAEAGIP